jgi:hypothetical protein
MPPVRAISAPPLAVSCKKPRFLYAFAMCCHMTSSGEIIPVWSRTVYDVVMQSCARIGFKP